MTIATPKPHLAHIDCLRGYAVLLVMTHHLTYAIAGLPYPIARLTVQGWYGVQLFFLMSAFTLLNSWRAEVHRNGRARIGNFFIRRFLRIAPAYYVAALLYALIRSNSGFDVVQLFTTLTFTNSWHPLTMPTVPGRWTVVPGGWSIGVEFAFYAIFPLLAGVITTMSRAIFAFFAATLLGLICNLAAARFLASTAPVPLSNFLYFWLPNQLDVFVLGMALYFLIGDSSPPSVHRLNWVRPYRYWFAGVAVLGFLSASFVPRSHYIGAGAKVPETLFISVPLLIFVAALASGPTIFVNRPIQELGKVSFSAYLLHFAALEVFTRNPSVFGVKATGISAIAVFAIDSLVLTLGVYGAAYLLYRAVELPGMLLAKRLTRLRSNPALAPGCK